MRISIFLMALATIAVPAMADVFPIVVKAHEANLPSLRLPGNVNGTLSFKACSSCEFRTVRVTPATRYEADGRQYTLEDFRQAVAGISDRKNTAVTVKHHLESDTVTAVQVTTFRGE